MVLISYYYRTQHATDLEEHTPALHVYEAVCSAVEQGLLCNGRRQLKNHSQPSETTTEENRPQLNSVLLKYD